jgi:hypothetical protein
MSFDVNDTMDAEPESPRMFAGKYELGDPATPVRVRRLEAKYPREAKISFAVGVSLLVFVGLIPVVRIAMNSLVKPDEQAATTTAPATTASSSSGPQAGAARPVSGGGPAIGDAGFRGGQAPASSGDAPPPKTRPDDDEIPMSPTAYETLKRLWHYIYEMSHLPKNAQSPNPKEGDWFLPEMLEGAPDDVVKNLMLLQLRVAHQPLLGLRVLSEEHNLGLTTFQLEVVSMGPNDIEISASTRVDLAVAAKEDEAMRIVRFERLEAFDDVATHAEEGGAPEATAEPPAVRAGRLPPPQSADGAAQAVDTRYPYTIR